MFGTENILQVFSIKMVRRAFGPIGQDVQEARARDFQIRARDRLGIVRKLAGTS